MDLESSHGERRSALIVGAGSRIAQAIAQALPTVWPELRVLGVSRSGAPAPGFDRMLAAPYDASGFAAAAQAVHTSEPPLALFVCAIGVLHDAQVTPEKRLAGLSGDGLRHYFDVNAVAPALALQAFSPILPRQQPMRIGILTAKVGSIADNRAGGWYGYRASKAALNMLVKTAAIELARSHRQAVVVALHPGTTDTPLSQPFTGKTPADRLYTPEQTGLRLARVLRALTPGDTGQFLNWDGTPLPW